MKASLALCSVLLAAPGGDRYAHLEERSPFYPDRSFPKLTTPMWFGEEGVDAAVILSIDDLRETENYRVFIAPILERLRALEGRSPFSIFCNRLNPGDPQFLRWHEDGVRFDVHTSTHPCPLLQGDFARAVAEVLDSIDNIAAICGSPPAAFRMPCCDSINSASPRFYWEILPRVSRGGRFLEATSSVAMFLDARDRAYAPFRNYAATAEGYPYPFVVAKLFWEFPIIVPTDWQAHNRRGPFHPETVDDLKRNLDLVVAARGLYTLCFHPHGWIRSEQVVELIDHAAARYGRRVRFLSFHDALERMEKHLLGGARLRALDGEDQGVRLLDLDRDGFLDVVIGNDERRETRLWEPAASRWRAFPAPFRIVARGDDGRARETGVKFAVLRRDGPASALALGEEGRWLWHLEAGGWREAVLEPIEAQGEPVAAACEGRDRGMRLRDLDGDGLSDLLVNNERQNAAFRWDPAAGRFAPLPFALPSPASIADGKGRDRGLRFVDADGDARDDVLLSNDDEYYLYLFEDGRGWSRRVLHGPAGSSGALPRTASAGQDTGAWFHGGALYVMNEGTAGKPDLVEVRRLDRLLEHRSDPPLEPEEALGRFRLSEGFRVELVAAEPQVQDPVSIEFGADGRIWVVEMASYPRGEGKDSGGRVKSLRDRDGDGRIDESILFAGGLTFPTGALPLGRGLLVTCAPDIIYLEDSDGDGRADLRRAVFTGFGEGNTQHRVNGLHRGIDGWIYGANGDSGGSITLPHRPDHPAVSISGRDFRFRPDLSVFEAESGRTQFGLALDDLGNRFGSSNSRHLLHAVIPERYLGRNPHQAPPDPVVDIPDHGAMARIFPVSRRLLSLNAIHVPGHFSSACGVALYRGEAFPEPYRGSAFVCEPVGNLVHRDVLDPRGATFSARRGEEGSEFLASTDPWFRPVGAATGPDGALYICDMYRWVIEHPQYIPEELHHILDFTAGRDRGRIWRVVHGSSSGGKGPSLHPDLTRESAARLVELLEHKNGWWRDAAQRLLVEREETAALGPLRDLASRSSRPLGRLHALWSLEALGGLDETLVARALDDRHPGVREHALRLAEPRLARSESLRRRVIAAAGGDLDFRVRFQAALTLGGIEGEEAAEALLALLGEHLEDGWVRAAVLSSALPHAGRLLGRLLSPGWRRGRETEAWLAVVAGLTRTAARKGDREEVAKLLSGAGVERHHLVLLAAFEESGVPLEDPEIAVQVQHIRRQARATALHGARNFADRTEAVRALGAALLEGDLLQELLMPRQPVEVQLAAVAALGRSRADPARAAAGLLEAWPGASPAVRAEILEAILRRPEGARALLEAVRSGRVPPREVDARSRERVLASVEPSGREAAAALFSSKPPGERAVVVERYRRALASLQGDAERGKEVFRAHCASCHRLEGEGVNVGPDLAESQAKDAAALLEAILNPSRMVPPRYTLYTVEVKGRGVSTGIIAGETSAAITLLRANGVSETILRSDLALLSSLGDSLMPAEIEKAIPPESMAHLIEFLLDRPAALGGLAAARVAESRRRALAQNGLAEVVQAAGREDQQSHVGTVRMAYCRQLEGADTLVWRTDPVPAGLALPARHAFRFSVAMGYKSQPQGRFTLFLGERKLLEFDVSLESGSWKSPGGEVELRWRVRARDLEDATGEMALELPASLLEPGKPATLRVVGSPAASRRWFGVLPLR